MALSYVNSIASLDALKSALTNYSGQSLAAVQGFASVLSNKIQHLESLERHFVRRVEETYAAWNQCEIARSYDPPEFRRSCHWQESAYRQAEANLNRYRSIMARVHSTQSNYSASASRYTNSLHNITSSTNPKFSTLITELRNYYNDGEMFGAGATSTLPAAGGTMAGASTFTFGADIFGSTSAQSGANAGSSTSQDAEGASNVSSTTGKTTANGNSVTVNIENKSSVSMATIGIVSGLGAGVAAAVIANYLKRRGTIFDGANLEEILIDDAFREAHGVGQTELLMMPESPTKDKLIKEYNDLCSEVEMAAKLEHDRIIQEWAKEMGEFSWDNVYERMNKQQFVSIAAEMAKNNQEELPLPSMSDDKNYYFYAQNSNEVYIVSKNGNEMNRLKMSDNYNYYKNLSSSISVSVSEEYEKINPKEVMFWGVFEKGDKYEINKDGSFSKFDIQLDISDTSSGLLSKTWNVKGKASYVSSDVPKIVFTKDESGSYTSDFNWGSTKLRGSVEGELGGAVSAGLTHKGISVTSPSDKVPSVGFDAGFASLSTDGTTHGGNIGLFKGSYTKNEEIAVGVGKKIGKIAEGSAEIYGGIHGVGAKGSLGASAGPLKIEGSLKGGVKDLDVDFNMYSHKGDKLLSQFNPELAHQIKKDFINDTQTVAYYEKRPYDPKFDHRSLLTIDKPPIEKQTQLLTFEIEKSEQYFQICKTANSYTPQTSLTNAGLGLGESFKINNIPETPLSPHSEGFKSFSEAASKYATSKNKR